MWFRKSYTDACTQYYCRAYMYCVYSTALDNLLTAVTQFSQPYRLHTFTRPARTLPACTQQLSLGLPIALPPGPTSTLSPLSPLPLPSHPSLVSINWLCSRQSTREACRRNVTPLVERSAWDVRWFMSWVRGAKRGRAGGGLMVNGNSRRWEC